MIRTRVGYAGGTTENPTYQDIGDHSETIQIDYDPALISFKELLEVFWTSHRPTSPAYSRQYASLILYHNEDQNRLAQETKNQQAAEFGADIHTEIIPMSDFYLAEDYHQKYRLQSVPALAQAFDEIYPDAKDLTNSTAAARANGLAGGYGTLSEVERELDRLRLPVEVRERLIKALSRFEP